MTMKIMSFNLRYDNEGDGINAFSSRLHRVIDTIRSENADIIGFQETTVAMRETLRSRLNDYVLVGCGRDRNYDGEGTIIAYKAELFELINLENIWLSDTPSVPGSHFMDDHSNCPRMLTCAVLKHHEYGEPFRMINTHLDHVGTNARLSEARFICDFVLRGEGDFILVGDFNATPDAPEIKYIVDTLSTVGGADISSEVAGTFHNFGKFSEESKIKIDYIFSSLKSTRAYRVEDTPIDNQYYSDHHAVCAEVDIK